MRQEGRGIGLHNKIKAYSLQDQGLDTIEANETLGFEPDLRHYGVGAQILLDLGARKLNLLTNNPKKVVGLSGFDLEIVDRIPVEAEVTDENRTYLNTKKARMGHILGNCSTPTRREKAHRECGLFSYLKNSQRRQVQPRMQSFDNLKSDGYEAITPLPGTSGKPQ